MSLWHPKRGFPPFPHANTHKYGGSDQLFGLDASQIESGVFSLDRVPKIPPDKLDAIDTPSDGEVPSYNATQGKFEWIPMAAGGITGNDILRLIQKNRGLFWFNHTWAPNCVENGKSGSGYIEWWYECVSLYTGATAGSYSYVLNGIYRYPYGSTWERKRYLSVWIFRGWFGYNYHMHIVSGSISSISSISNTDEHIGFKVVNNAMYGTVADGSSESVLNLGISTGGDYLLECEFIPNVECKFYVNGVYRGSIDTNLPFESRFAHYLFYASVYNSDPANIQLIVRECRVFQEG